MVLASFWKKSFHEGIEIGKGISEKSKLIFTQPYANSVTWCYMWAVCLIWGDLPMLNDTWYHGGIKTSMMVHQYFNSWDKNIIPTE